MKLKLFEIKKLIRYIIRECYHSDARFGLGAIGSNGEVKFKEFNRDVFGDQQHGRLGNPHGKYRFRYMDGIVEWSDCGQPDDAQAKLADDWLTRHGYPVVKHTSIYTEPEDFDVDRDYDGD
jgi:hypothetical protein